MVKRKTLKKSIHKKREKIKKTKKRTYPKKRTQKKRKTNRKTNRKTKRKTNRKTNRKTKRKTKKTIQRGAAGEEALAEFAGVLEEYDEDEEEPVAAPAPDEYIGLGGIDFGEEDVFDVLDEGGDDEGGEVGLEEEEEEDEEDEVQYDGIDKYKIGDTIYYRTNPGSKLPVYGSQDSKWYKGTVIGKNPPELDIQLLGPFWEGKVFTLDAIEIKHSLRTKAKHEGLEAELTRTTTVKRPEKEAELTTKPEPSAAKPLDVHIDELKQKYLDYIKEYFNLLDEGKSERDLQILYNKFIDQYFEYIIEKSIEMRAGVGKPGEGEGPINQVKWGSLDSEKKKLLESLGWVNMEENDLLILGPIPYSQWGSLEPEYKEKVIALGYDEESWDEIDERRRKRQLEGITFIEDEEGE